jgi:hypothetical protein
MMSVSRSSRAELLNDKTEESKDSTRLHGGTFNERMERLPPRHEQTQFPRRRKGADHPPKVSVAHETRPSLSYLKHKATKSK